MPQNASIVHCCLYPKHLAQYTRVTSNLTNDKHGQQWKKKSNFRTKQLAKNDFLDGSQQRSDLRSFLGHNSPTGKKKEIETIIYIQRRGRVEKTCLPCTITDQPPNVSYRIEKWSNLGRFISNRCISLTWNKRSMLCIPLTHCVHLTRLQTATK